MSLSGYYNRFDKSKNYEKTMFLSGRGLQSAELNEVQDYAISRISGIGDAIFADGDVISGAICIINPETGSVIIESGKIYLRGSVRNVDSASFTIPTDKSVIIGIKYAEKSITELEDPTLRDPAVGTRNYQESGAARLKSELAWGFKVAGTLESGEFYAVYNVENGVLIQNAPPPQLDSVQTAIARYDKESNGSYVVKGMNVTYLKTENNEQTFVISEGKAHVDGYEIELSHSLRVKLIENPDIQMIESDPYTFQADLNSDGSMTVNLNNTPIKEIIKVDATIEKTITMTHGSYTGCLDAIPDTAVLEIVQISQGQTVYSNGSDYRLKSGEIDWSPGGLEPAPGSSYKLIYRIRGKLIPTDITEKSFKIKGAVTGSLVLVDYSWKLPRYDLITIDSKGITSRIQGIAHEFKPSLPKTPSNQIALAYITQNWEQDSKPTITNCAVKVIPMSDIEAMRSAISNLYSLVAEERLKNDANASDPASKKGIFVDPFLDDDMRDQGTPQTAAIVDHCLTLPIKAEIFDLGKVDKPWTLPYELTPILEQTLQTGSMKINPYQSFAPVPADAQITLDIDRWSEVQTTWASPVTQRFSTTSSPLTQKTYVGTSLPTKELSRSTSTSYSSSTSTTNELLSSKIIEGEFMRQIKQTFALKGFQPKENLTVIFDGITANTTNLEKK